MAKNFGATSTTDDVLEGVDLSGKRVLVTGVSATRAASTATLPPADPAPRAECCSRRRRP